MPKKRREIPPLKTPHLRRPFPESRTVVQRVSFSTDRAGNPVLLGKGSYGLVYIGRIKLQGNKFKRVAIKRFSAPDVLTYMSEEYAKRYEKAIEDLRKAGVRLPKMGLIEIPKGTRFGRGEFKSNEWVQVSQLFGSTAKGTKIRPIHRLGLSAKKDLFREIIKTANAGYLLVPDLFEAFRDRAGKMQIIPLDIDGIVGYGRAKPQLLAHDVCNNLEALAKLHGVKLEEVIEIVKDSASPELKDEIRKIRPHWFS